MIGVIGSFNFVDKYVVIRRSDEPKEEQFYATGQTIDGMLRETDLANLTEFEVDVDGRIVTSFRRLRDLTRDEFKKESTIQKTMVTTLAEAAAFYHRICKGYDADIPRCFKAAFSARARNIATIAKSCRGWSFNENEAFA